MNTSMAMRDNKMNGTDLLREEKWTPSVICTNSYETINIFFYGEFWLLKQQQSLLLSSQSRQPLNANDVNPPIITAVMPYTMKAAISSPSDRGASSSLDSITSVIKM